MIHEKADLIDSLREALVQKPLWEEFCLLARLVPGTFAKCVTCRRGDPSDCAYYPYVRDDILTARKKSAAEDNAGTGQSGAATPEAKDAMFWDRLLRLSEAAEVVGLTTRTMRKLRLANRGPASIRVCGRELHFQSDLNAWLETHRRKRWRH